MMCKEVVETNEAYSKPHSQGKTSHISPKLTKTKNIFIQSQYVKTNIYYYLY